VPPYAVCQIVRLKCTKFDFRSASAPDAAGGAYSAPLDPLAVFEGSNFKGRGGRGSGMEGKGAEGKRREKGGEGGGRGREKCEAYI